MYRRLSLLRLAELIANNGNRQALRELHDNRSLFCYDIDGPLRLVEFVDKLRQSKPAWRWCSRKLDILDRAYDLTISKFSHLPDAKKIEARVKQEGPDCRLYYAAYIRHVAKKMETESYKNRAEKEIRMAGLLQNLVIHHFRLSCLECSRTGTELTRRYLWKLNGATLSVRLPVQIPGSQCGNWLAENIGDVDPARPGEAYFITKGYHGPRKITTFNLAEKLAEYRIPDNSELRTIISKESWFLDLTNQRVLCQLGMLEEEIQTWNKLRRNSSAQLKGTLNAYDKVKAKTQVDKNSLTEIANKAKKIENTVSAAYRWLIRQKELFYREQDVVLCPQETRDSAEKLNILVKERFSNARDAIVNTADKLIRSCTDSTGERL